jgi:hypothetical protein
MHSYLLRDIDPALWRRFKERSDAEGIPMRALVLLLVEAYTDGKVNISARKAAR